jgi:hypothetical protein
MGRKIERVPEFSSDLEKSGGQKKEIHLMFVGGLTVLPTILPSRSLGRNEVND